MQHGSTPSHTPTSLPIWARPLVTVATSFCLRTDCVPNGYHHPYGSRSLRRVPPDENHAVGDCRRATRDQHSLRCARVTPSADDCRRATRDQHSFRCVRVTPPAGSSSRHPRLHCCSTCCRHCHSNGDTSTTLSVVTMWPPCPTVTVPYGPYHCPAGFCCEAPATENSITSSRADRSSTAAAHYHREALSSNRGRAK